MTPYKRGDVVLVAFPFTDLTTTKMRPAVVVSSDKLNRKFNDVIVIAVTSQIHKKLSDEEFPLSTEDQKSAGLPKPSIIKLGKLVTLDQRLIRKKLGHLPILTLSRMTGELHAILQ